MKYPGPFTQNLDDYLHICVIQSPVKVIKETSYTVSFNFKLKINPHVKESTRGRNSGLCNSIGGWKKAMCKHAPPEKYTVRKGLQKRGGKKVREC